MNAIAKQPVPAEWTPDCQGKWDYDGKLVSLSTRYWPRGGGFHILDSKGFRDSAVDHPEIHPSAKATIYLGSTADDYLDDAVVLCEREFEASTKAAVQAQVETWVEEQFERIGKALKAEFLPTTEQDEPR